MREESMRNLLFHYNRERRLLSSAWVDLAMRDKTNHCVDCLQGWCCYQLPLAHVMEGIVAAHYLLKSERGDAAELIEKVHDQGARQYEIMVGCLEEASALLKQGKEQESIQAAETHSAKWYATGEPCCFLAKIGMSHSCLVYQYRPVTCSTYYVGDRCQRKYSCDDLVPMLDNRQIVSSMYELSDAAYSDLVGWRASVLPLPFVYAVSVGLRQLQGEGVDLVSSESDLSEAAMALARKEIAS